MTHDIELDLLSRPGGGTAVSLVASRLRLGMMDVRNGLMHDHAVRGQVDASMTVAPAGSGEWCYNAELLWNRVEWCERYGNAPIAFEVRARLPGALTGSAVHRFARELAGYVARDLNVPVTFTALQGSAPWSVREAGDTSIQMCFPTRILALNDGSNAVGDRSGAPSGFAGRLAMVSNPHLVTQFTRRVALEMARLEKASAGWERASSPTVVARRARSAFPFDDLDLWADIPPAPAPAPSENPATHPLLARLRREAPRSMTVPDLRDFEIAMGFARTVEETLAEVVAHSTACDHLHGKRTQLQTAILDHLHLLDIARRTRAARVTELEELQKRKDSFMVFLRGRIELASLARERKAVELRRARGHVEELKGAISRLRHQERRLASDTEATALVLSTACRELRDAVKTLHGADPRLLQHLLTILGDDQRRHVKKAMSDAVPEKPTRESPASDEDGRAGPPAKPTRGSRLG
ncbi:MobA/MobL family protein [Luteibacter aegosomatissinici]|uniref:MobA/MobL family protein n=1 Tax=Luteibacter aegosomatissinici TaxID=2911539 RepID=UPI001FFC1AB4|nr:MobA/MobL family protein [Luteibacter aegosomatissinici]UPG92842.1 MobA/MobL family protein [Luteibacter aegosomatissinici]